MFAATTCCCWQRTLTIFVFVLSITNICFGVEVYFPMSALHLNLPINEKSHSIFSKMPIVRLQAIFPSNNSAATQYVYGISRNTILDVNSTTGEVFMKNDYPLPIVDKINVIITAITKSNDDNLSIPHVTLQLQRLDESEYCRNLENICFWSSVQYKVMEDSTSISHQSNFTPLVVGTVNPRGARHVCPNMNIRYKLETHTDLFQLEDNMLLTRTLLDHEALNLTNDDNLHAVIKCTINMSENGIKEFRRSFNITVIDRNDNAPELQDNQNINFRLNDPHFKMNDKIGQRIILIDKDTLEKNSHMNYVIHNDTNEIINPECNEIETDHTGRRQTVISCQLLFKRNGILSEQYYCFVLEAVDETVDVAVSKKSVHANICLNNDPSKIHEADRPKALRLRSQKSRKSNIIDSDENSLHLDSSNTGGSQLFINTYPKDVYVNRTAKPYYRVAQPKDFRELMSKTKIQFHIAEDRSHAFGITTTSGILYLKDVMALKQSLETVYFLNITWQDTYQKSFVINVHLMNDVSTLPNTSGACENKAKRGSQTCAQKRSQVECKKFCGYGTSGAGCMWRGKNSSALSVNYASCVPVDIYCPDHICDPLEELNGDVCPQDCTASHNIIGPHSANTNKRGIYSASGTCYCGGNGKCTCGSFPASENVNNKPKYADVESVEKNQNKNDVICGESCLLMTASFPILLLLLLLSCFLYRRSLKKRAKGKSSLIQSKKPMVANIAADCDVLNGDLPLTHLQPSENFKFTIDDLKWEFARDKLVLDTVLGEGEFGKVIKAYATNIAGMKGVTTVAVKMLKTGANSVEYAALLSEFQLLQEVSHPNVIKLLGACTTSETLMIIIEYARYGSLRSYLRLSRKIECTGAEFSDGIEPVTVKDILSFAWQISKGMAYLTEIKLVHRDLAARNVLLADNKICKISDFGLTRDIYEDDAYLKQSRDRVPVKWMAPESLADHVYTTKTDVWAFGVLCWEIINLGASPYPGVPPQNLYHLLKSGYRMERPDHCSDEIYNIVRSCWAADPNGRPSFKYLAAQLEKLLGNNAKYIELESHAISNPMYCVDEEILSISDNSDLSKLVANDIGDPDCLDHLWRPPKLSGFDVQDGTNSREFSLPFSGSDFVPPGYDMPRPLIEASSAGQALRYENDLRFPLNARKSACNSFINQNVCSFMKNANELYSVPVKRGRSYIDMTNKTLIPDNLDNKDFEKNISKTISFRFSSLLNLNNQQQDDAV